MQTFGERADVSPDVAGPPLRGHSKTDQIAVAAKKRTPTSLAAAPSAGCSSRGRNVGVIYVDSLCTLLGGA
jgi:hypothetical protein